MHITNSAIEALKIWIQNLPPKLEAAHWNFPEGYPNGTCHSVVAEMKGPSIAEKIAKRLEYIAIGFQFSTKQNFVCLMGKCEHRP